MATPDRKSGPSFEEGTYYEDNGTVSTEAGELRYAGGKFSLFDAAGEFDPRAGGSGMSEAQHEALDSLTHELAEDSFEELTYSGNKVTNSTVWTSPAKTLKIRETQITYSSNKVSQAVDIQYNAAGVEVYRLTQVMTYSGKKVQTVTTTRTP